MYCVIIDRFVHVSEHFITSFSPMMIYDTLSLGFSDNEFLKND